MQRQRELEKNEIDPIAIRCRERTKVEESGEMLAHVNCSHETKDATGRFESYGGLM